MGQIHLVLEGYAVLSPRCRPGQTGEIPWEREVPPVRGAAGSFVPCSP